MTHQQVAQGIDYAHHLLQYDKARERTHRRLMRLYYLANSRTAALRQFERCRAALAEELGVGPSNRTLALYHQIQEDQVTDLWQTSPPIGSALEPTPPSDSPVLTELKQIRTRLAALQLDIQAIKNDIKRKLPIIGLTLLSESSFSCGKRILVHGLYKFAEVSPKL